MSTTGWTPQPSDLHDAPVPVSDRPAARALSVAMGAVGVGLRSAIVWRTFIQLRPAGLKNRA